MTESIIVALITLVGVIVSALLTKNNLYSELEKKDALMEQKLEVIDEHLREHNHYAKLYAETMPVVQEQMKHINERLDKVEEYERSTH